MSDYKEIKLKDQGLSISNNDLSMTVDIEEVINQFTADEIVGNVYNREEIYKILKKEFEGRI
jgi:4'-phosphopantetheinyl transferase EntD